MHLDASEDGVAIDPLPGVWRSTKRLAKRRGKR
jgi:hypothetical protein